MTRKEFIDGIMSGNVYKIRDDFDKYNAIMLGDSEGSDFDFNKVYEDKAVSYWLFSTTYQKKSFSGLVGVTRAFGKDIFFNPMDSVTSDPTKYL